MRYNPNIDAGMKMGSGMGVALGWWRWVVPSMPQFEIPNVRWRLEKNSKRIRKTIGALWKEQPNIDTNAFYLPSRHKSRVMFGQVRMENPWFCPNLSIVVDDRFANI